MRLLLLLILLVTSSFIKIFASPGNHDSLLQRIATQDVPPRSPGIATGIVKNGKVIFSLCAGLANLSDSSAIDADSRFNIASNGKQFTALTILWLADSGLLSLQQDIRKYLPSLYPSIKQPITIAHLLTHRSGIRDVYDLWSLKDITWWKMSYSNLDVIQLISQQTQLNSIPGSEYRYSNSNYLLLASIIEKVTGKSFVQVTRQLFDRLGMFHTGFEDNYQQIKGPVAHPYFNFSTWSNYNWIWNACGDGNLFSTLSDQLRWEQLIQKKSSDRLGKLIQKSQLPINPKWPEYGAGLEFGKYKQQNYRFHEGATGAWKATVIRFGDTLSLLTLTNSGKTIPYDQTRQMADVLLQLNNDNTKSWATAPEQVGPWYDSTAVTGIYQTSNNFTFRFELREGILYLIRSGRNDIKLTRASANCFQQSNDPAFKLAFTKNEKGEEIVTAYYTTHAPYSLKKIDKDISLFNAASLNGDYINDETGVSLSIQHDKDRSFRVLLNTNERVGLLINPARMMIDNYQLDITWKNKQPVILLQGDRIKNVVFHQKKK
jgi:CubicO group peptidase (beta-lactamase class C family)